MKLQPESWGAHIGPATTLDNVGRSRLAQKGVWALSSLGWSRFCAVTPTLKSNLHFYDDACAVSLFFICPCALPVMMMHTQLLSFSSAHVPCLPFSSVACLLDLSLALVSFFFNGWFIAFSYRIWIVVFGLDGFFFLTFRIFRLFWGWYGWGSCTWHTQRTSGGQRTVFWSWCSPSWG